MTQKKRISELAKEYGIPGPDLVKKLKDRGFTHVKGPASTLEDYQVMQVEGMLEAEGKKRVGTGDAPPTADASAEHGAGGLVLRKKKKKLSLTGEAEDEKHEAAPEPPAPTPARRLEPEPAPLAFEPEPAAAAVDESPEATIELQPAPAPAPAPAPLELEPAAALAPEPVHVPHSAATAAPAVETAEPEPEPALASTPAPGPVATAPHAPAVVEPRRAEPAMPVEASKTLAPTTPGPNVPVPRKPAGKVLGFIDLSKLKTNQPKRPVQESRRLRSKDDVAPNVQPTLGHDKKKALVRGDRGTRENLSAGQLREQQGNRFLRRAGPIKPGQPGAGPGQSQGPRERSRGREGGVSPYAGTSVDIDLPVTVKKLAERLSVKPFEVLSAAMRGLGLSPGQVNINSILDDETATLLAHEFEVDLKIRRIAAAEEALIQSLTQKRSDVQAESLALRPPTVAFLGHVDHGKTTLIDTIRKSRIAEGEAGGITQHIGAYQVTTKKGHTLTVIDTPGHAAFTSMRARGARAVDIVVLVVAADDGPMPQTEEALNHARAAKVPIVVALTKADKPEANVKRAMEQISSRLGLHPEEWGGTTAMLPVAALKGQGVEELLERVFLESEVLELKCHPQGPAKGVVLEAEVHEGKGIVAHLLIQDGTLNRGDVILAGEGYGKVRSMHDDLGRVVATAPPSLPVEVMGLDKLPSVGETFYVLDSLAKAKEVAEEREKKTRALQMATERRTIDAASLLKAVANSKRQSINLVVRADVQGSVEVLKSALGELKHEEVEVKVLHAGVGAVTESDVMLAASSGGTIISFHASTNDKARTVAEREGVAIRYYEVLYELLDDIRDLMEGMLAPEMREEITGHAEVRALFKSSKVGLISGCMVIDGSIFRDSKIRVKRENKVVHEGLLSSLKRVKDDVKEVREGFECGLTLRDFPEPQLGDILEAYRINKVKRGLGDK
ncbi:MAG: translation initiation factor IF-2 [Planctomycetes bacterium]|nr:translation initiation factor IF-2 [Planctomycetota bacterium]